MTINSLIDKVEAGEIVGIDFDKVSPFIDFFHNEKDVDRSDWHIQMEVKRKIVWFWKQMIDWSLYSEKNLGPSKSKLL